MCWTHAQVSHFSIELAGNFQKGGKSNTIINQLNWMFLNHKAHGGRGFDFRGITFCLQQFVHLAHAASKNELITFLCVSPSITRLGHQPLKARIISFTHRCPSETNRESVGTISETSPKRKGVAGVGHRPLPPDRRLTEVAHVVERPYVP